MLIKPRVFVLVRTFQYLPFQDSLKFARKAEASGLAHKPWTWLEKPGRNKDSSLPAPFVTFKEYKVLKILILKKPY